MLKCINASLGMMAHTFNASTRKAEAARSLKFKATLLYNASSKIVRATLKNPVLKKKEKKIYKCFNI